jgi:hypothetical protein
LKIISSVPVSIESIMGNMIDIFVSVLVQENEFLHLILGLELRVEILAAAIMVKTVRRFDRN